MTDIFDLIARLGDGDADARQQALRNVLDRAAEAVPALIGIVQNRDSAQRAEAIGALGEIGLDAGAAVEPLIHVLRSEETEAALRRRAARALKDIDLVRPRVLGHLILAAGCDAPEVSAGICDLLEPIARLNPAILDAHVGALSHKNVNVRRGAAAVIRKVAEAGADEIYIRQAASRMAELPPDEDPSVREDIRAAIELMTG